MRLGIHCRLRFAVAVLLSGLLTLGGAPTPALSEALEEAGITIDAQENGATEAVDDVLSEEESRAQESQTPDALAARSEAINNGLARQAAFEVAPEGGTVAVQALARMLFNRTLDALANPDIQGADSALAQAYGESPNSAIVAGVFSAVAQELGLECAVVESKNSGQCWNLVKIDELWYHVDAWAGHEDAGANIENVTASEDVSSRWLLVGEDEIAANDDLHADWVLVGEGEGQDEIATSTTGYEWEQDKGTAEVDAGGFLNQDATDAQLDSLTVQDAGYCIRNISESDVSWSAGSNSDGTLPAAASKVYARRRYYLNLQVTDNVSISKLVLTVNPPNAQSYQYTFQFNNYVHWASYPCSFTYAGKGSYTWYLEYKGGGSDTFTNTFTVSKNPTTLNASDYLGTYDGSYHSISCNVSGPSSYTLYYSTSDNLDEDNYASKGSTSRPSLRSGMEEVYVFLKDNTGAYENATASAVVCVKPKVTVSNWSGTYDGMSHSPSVTCNGGRVYYRLGEPFPEDSRTLLTALRLSSGWTAEKCNVLESIPAQTNAGSLTIYYLVIPNEGKAIPKVGQPSDKYVSAPTGSVTVNVTSKPLSSCSMTLSPSSYNYDGGQKSPTIVVKDGSKTLLQGTDFYVSNTPSGRTNPGSYTYTVTGKGNYTGNKSATFTIAPVNSYTISYDANGGTGVPSSQAKVQNASIALSSIKPTKSYVISYNSCGGSVSPASKSLSCTFKNWNTQRSGGGTSYASGATYSTNASVTLYAQWANPTVGTLATPTRSGYTFTGWFTSASGGQQVTASTTATSNMTLYAHWTDPYNLGDETYSFSNYSDTDALNGHCFGMSMTSAGYHNNLLDIGVIGGNASTPLYSFDDTWIVRQPICRYQKKQGEYRDNATVAGGSAYLKDNNDIASDWNDVIGYVKNHAHDNKGTLQIGFRGKYTYYGSVLEGGHAINFLRYENVNGQDRIYAYDNNCPNKETYFYKNANGKVIQAPYQTFDVSIDCMALRDVKTYFNSIGSFDATHAIYVREDTVSVQGYSYSRMEGSLAGVEYVMYEIPAGTRKVTIVPHVANANFIYMDTEYSFGKITAGTRGELKFTTMDEGLSNADGCFTIYEAGSSIPNAILSATSFAYDGRVHKPTVTVKVGGTTLRESQDYDIKYPSDVVNVGEHQIKVTLKGKYSGSIVKSYVITKGTQTIAASDKYVPVGKTIAIGAKTNGDGKLAYKTSDASVAVVSSTGVVTGKKAGTTKITVTAARTTHYKTASKTITVTVVGPNTITAKAKKKAVKVSLAQVNKKAQKLKSNIKVAKAQGKIRYANVSSSKKARKLKVNAKTGKVKVPKGTKKGTYKLKIKITASGDSTHGSATRTVSYKVVVR